MSDVIDLKAKRLEKAKTLKEEFLIDNDNEPIAVAMLPLIDALEKLTDSFMFFLHDFEDVEPATEFINHCMAMFDAATESMIEQVENKSEEPFFFYDEVNSLMETAKAEKEFGFTHGEEILDRFVLETRRENGTFDLERAVEMASSLRYYHIHLTQVIGQMIEDQASNDPLARHKPIT